MRSILVISVLGLVFAARAEPAATPLLSAPEQEAARKLYLTKCAKCHKLYNPASYSEAKWQHWMGKMAHKAKLTPEQERLVSAYIDEHLRAPAKPNSR